MPTLRSTLPVALLAVASACSSVAVRTCEVETLTGTDARTYGWVDDRVPLDTEGAPVRNEELLAQFRAAIDAELADRGYVLVPIGDAAFEATLHVGVSADVRRNDPYYALYTWERIERAHVAFALADTRDGALAWSASGEGELRTTALGTGHSGVEYVETEDARDWNVERLANAVLDELPRR